MLSLRAGKDVFVEWLLGANLREVKELAALAKEKGVKNVVRLQTNSLPSNPLLTISLEKATLTRCFVACITLIVSLVVPARMPLLGMLRIQRLEGACLHYILGI